MAESHKKKILLIHTGGTLGMNLSGSPQDIEKFVHDLKTYVPRMFEVADITVDILLNKDSSNMVPGDWVLMAKRLHENREKFDAFVLTHGTDTMSFSASALSFMLQGFGKPVIITGSQVALADSKSDAPRNLVHAVEIAAEGRVREICIFFDSSLLRGNRAKKISIPSFGAFDSPNFPPLAKVGIKIEYAPGLTSPERPYTFDPRIETRVACLPLFPGIDTELFMGLVEKGVKGLILQAFGPGDIPLGELSVVHLIRRLTELGIPTVICSQAVFGAVDLSLYETGRAARTAGAISAHDMTWETALVKTMILLGRGLTMGPFREALPMDFAGELSLQN